MSNSSVEIIDYTDGVTTVRVNQTIVKRFRYAERRKYCPYLRKIKKVAKKIFEIPISYEQFYYFKGIVNDHHILWSELDKYPLMELIIPNNPNPSEIVKVLSYFNSEYIIKRIFTAMLNIPELELMAAETILRLKI
jgi:hypothetical protein